MATTGAFGVEAVDGAALEGGNGVFDKAALVQRVGVDGDPRRRPSATARQLSTAAGVVPQSSCSFKPIAPASTCWRSASGRAALPLPRKPRSDGTGK